MPTIEELLSTYEETESLAEAERALDAVAEQGIPEEVSLGDLYDQLAEVAVEDGDLALGIRAQRRAIELGCEYLELARDMLAWYLLKDGQRAAGEAAFSELRAERGDDVGLLLTIGNARGDSGDEEGALEAFDESFALAKHDGDPDLIYEARAERRESRSQLGLPLDADDLEVGSTGPRPVEQVRWSVAWFPRDELEAARGGRTWEKTSRTRMHIAAPSRAHCVSLRPKPGGDPPSPRSESRRSPSTRSHTDSTRTRVQPGAGSPPRSTGKGALCRGRRAETISAGAAQEGSTNDAVQRDDRGHHVIGETTVIDGVVHGFDPAYAKRLAAIRAAKRDERAGRPG